MKIKSLTIWLMVIMFVVMNLLLGCDQRREYHKKTNQKVKVYKQHKHNVNNSNNDEWLFWYVMYYNNQYYYYSTPTYVSETSYSSINWQTSKSMPIEETSPTENLTVVEENVVPNQDLGQQMETVIDTTEQQISDMISEGNPNSQDISSPSDTSNGSTDGGSSMGDSGGAGDGGGDGGSSD